MTATWKPSIGPARPAWIRELHIALPITGQFLISGNVNDVHHLGAPERGFRSTVDLVRECLEANEYDLVYQFDPLSGITLEHERAPGIGEEFFPSAHLRRAGVGSISKLADLVLRSATQSELRAAVIVDSATSLWADPESVEISRLLLVSRRLATREPSQIVDRDRRASAGGVIVWIADIENDAPAWLRQADGTRVLRIPLPSIGARRAAAQELIHDSGRSSELDGSTLAAAVDSLAESTQGLTFRGMRSILSLAADQGISADRLSEAVRSYLAGVVESPWQDPLLLERVRDAPDSIQRRVIGQSRAVRRSLDVLVRSAMGLTGAHQGRQNARPQGILFFAGPTGVGKTELAKALAEVLFGTEDACTRFDMSEFSAEHSEARLVGAPPGYVGHGAGGELTNAVRSRPFSVLLFDEIEKAHPRILDKFLQILDDGRLTDGSGNTVYFSETVIVFTSNLGASSGIGHPAGEIEPSLASQEQRTRSAIEHHFAVELGRPELLSRIGDNIVVFDPISPETGRLLVRKYLQSVIDTVHMRRGVTVTLDHEVSGAVENYALTKLAFGGRGIGAAVESAFVNPLARALLSTGSGHGLHVSAIAQGEDGWVLDVRSSPDKAQGREP